MVARVLVTSRVNHRSENRVREGFHRAGATAEPRPMGEQTNKSFTGSSINLEQEHHQTLAIDRLSLRRHKLVVCRTGGGLRVCMAERSICCTRSSRGRWGLSVCVTATWALADFTTEMFFFFVPSCRNTAETRKKGNTNLFPIEISPVRSRRISVWHVGGTRSYNNQKKKKKGKHKKMCQSSASDGCPQCIGIQRSPRG